MRLILTVLIVFLVIDEGLADTSREDKVAYIMETMDFGGQIAAYNDEMVKRILEGMDANPQIELEEKIKFIVIEESISIIKIITDDYIDKISEVYVEIFSDEEIDTLYNFFRTPQGQSLGKKLPAFESKVYWIDAHFLELINERLGERIADRMSKEGYD